MDYEDLGAPFAEQLSSASPALMLTDSSDDDAYLMNDIGVAWRLLEERVAASATS